ncbi:NAD(P)/FAD-dependent oxidoreductase [Seongchinamella sediminis]|uniref:NAD(P)/FAD-dependent oxidoreductase n=2 Tax=Seongchinamella sediminis TaxID=2283635 RepID=A0A3L7DXU7_9GAMM|nr:NAD(P)/FAD-dependent oxidoreductase [Seongchinamella sediminis]
MAGMLAGIKLQESGFHNVTLYEKADRVGGTWRANSYPGLTCDVPSHHYTYTFERNPDWSRHLSPGGEIQAYFEQVARKYRLYELIEFNTGVERADFRNGRWHLELEGGRSDIADVVIAATGVLHVPSYPGFRGMDQFKGAMFHTARWDHDVDLEGKRVGVIGMGSTGVQIVSALSDRGIDVSHFVRTPQWIMPVENGHYSEQERALFRADPDALSEAMDFEGYAAAVEAYTDALTDPASEGSRTMSQACRDNLEQSIPDPALREQLRPDHEPLCKRLIFSPDYYQAIQRDCAHLVRADIDCFEAGGIRTADGVLHELDVIALATGFQADQFMRPMKITGRNGMDLETLWATRPVAYLAISMPDMPNFFMLNGPNGPVGNFSLIDIAEHQWAYIEQLIDKIYTGECPELCPSVTAMEDFDRARVAAAKTTIWYTGGCQSWYLDAEGVPASWPWSYSRFVAEMKTPRWEAFEWGTGDSSPAVA